MITQFKIFESINQGEPQKDDYVICAIDPSFNSTGCIEFVRNMIGQVIEVNPSFAPIGKPYYIEYKNLEREMVIKCFDVIHNLNGSKHISREEILFWSPNKEDLEKILTQQRFDL